MGDVDYCIVSRVRRRGRLVVTLEEAVRAWILERWSAEGVRHGATECPLVEFDDFELDHLGSVTPPATRSWIVKDGALELAHVDIDHIPYAAYSVDPVRRVAKVVLLWHGLCGYGYLLTFSPDLQVTDMHLAWIA